MFRMYIVSFTLFLSTTKFMVGTSKTEHSTLFPPKNIPKNELPKREVIGSHHGEAIVATTVLLSTPTIVTIVAVIVHPPHVAVDALLIL